jgi:hypothetical protein
MPRPKSGNPPWKALAVKLPPELLSEAQRYSDLYRIPLSTLLREGLAMRLQEERSTGLQPSTVASFSRLAETITRAVDELHRMGQYPTGEEYNSYTSTIPATQEPARVVSHSGNTVIPVVSERESIEKAAAELVPRLPDANEEAIRLLDADEHGEREYVSDTLEDDADYDPTKHQLGKLCPRKHDYRGTGQSVLRITNRHCRACDREKFRERKQAKRQAVQG